MLSIIIEKEDFEVMLMHFGIVDHIRASALTTARGV
jgi:hypothetical protein